MNKRLLPLTLIGCAYIVMGAIGFGWAPLDLLVGIIVLSIRHSEYPALGFCRT
jgi:hypothetical protein